MRRRWLVLSLTLCAVALSDTPAAVKVTQPRAAFVLSGPRGVTLPFQAWVQRHPDNRWVQLEVWNGDLRVQSSGWSIDGDGAAQTQPTYKPLSVTVGPGRYAFRALVCTSVDDDSECERVRGSAVHEVRVCGGSAEDC